MDKPFIEQGTGGPAYGSGAPEFSEQQKITIVNIIVEYLYMVLILLFVGRRCIVRNFCDIYN